MGKHQARVPSAVDEYRKLRRYVKRLPKDAPEEVRLRQAEIIASDNFPGENRHSEMWCWRVLDLFSKGD